MKASEIHEGLQEQVDKLQKEMKTSVRNQLVTSINLEHTQKKMRELMQVIIKDGDRDLTEEELTELGLL
jgi:hypothetical protein